MVWLFVCFPILGSALAVSGDAFSLREVFIFGTGLLASPVCFPTFSLFCAFHFFPGVIPPNKEFGFNVAKVGNGRWLFLRMLLPQVLLVVKVPFLQRLWFERPFGVERGHIAFNATWTRPDVHG